MLPKSNQLLSTLRALSLAILPAATIGNDDALLLWSSLFFVLLNQRLACTFAKEAVGPLAPHDQNHATGDVSVPNARSA